ncbi:MAG: hypothetical protein EA391_09580 [Balneolaceae bacterium]|nr:MAG: hypothetical protein EA391_09580 [Balneolaceae bacterium]
MKIAYIYYNFYPVTGGASVHGYYLARELSNLGFELYKINGEADPYTKKLKNRIIGLIWMLRNCDLFYIRMDYFSNFRNLITNIALLFNRKVVVELNSPSDELHLFGKTEQQIRKADKRMAAVLKRVDAVIVMSSATKRYCQEALGLKNVHVIENGGEVFNSDVTKVSIPIQDTLKEIRKNSDVIVIWPGSLNSMQHVDMIREVSEKVSDRISFLVVTGDDSCRLQKKFGDNVHIIHDASRADVEYMIVNSDAGLALYGDYSWCRWGFYNSSLKVFEYLNNGLETICNKEGSAVQQAYPNFHHIRNSDEIVTFLEETRTGRNTVSLPYRTWKDVALETSKILKEVIR